MSGDETVQELVSIATLGEGVLTDADEHRILKVLLTAGFSALESREKIDAALAALGARRAAAEKPAPLAPEPLPERAGAKAAESDKAALADKTATPDVVAKAITRSFQRPTRRPPPSDRLKTSSSDEVVVAELVSPPPPPPDEDANRDDTTRWSGICSSCLSEISTEDVRAGRAEVHPTGKRHCRACLSKLRAGLLCKFCYKPIDRASLLDGRAQLHADRAVHVACLKP